MGSHRRSPTGALPRFTRATMQLVADHPMANPLSDLINDEVYQALETHNVLSEKGIRDYHIRQRFRVLREEGLPAYDAIERLREEYPYLQFDTIRKIVYRLNGRRH